MTPLVNAKELARLLGISESQVHALTKKGLLPSLRIARSRRFDPDECLSALKGARMSEWIEAAKWLREYDEERWKSLPKSLRDRSDLEHNPEVAIVNMLGGDKR